MRMDWFKGNGLGQATATAGTAITRLLPPEPSGRTRLTRLVYTAGVTAHTLTGCRPIGRTSASAAGTAGQAVINLAADPGPSGNALAANDILAIRETDGITRVYVVSSLTGLQVTLTGNLTAGVAVGSAVWNFGVIGDTDPRIGSAHPTFTLPASATTTYAEDTAGVLASHDPDSPIYLSVNNITNAGTLLQTGHCYTRDAFPLS